jgi:hypothetical protein
VYRDERGGPLAARLWLCALRRQGTATFVPQAARRVAARSRPAATASVRAMSAATVPSAAVAECRRVAQLPRPWVVADMDSTLIRKSPGEWPDLEDSPVRAPLCTWLGSGGSLLIVTSDDGQRPWRSLIRQIPERLRGNVVLSTADGAVLSSLQAGEFTEEDAYWGCALHDKGVASTGLPSADLTTEIACELKRDFLADCMSSPELLATVSPDWRQESYAAIIAQFDTAAELREALTTDQMLAMNALMPRGSLVWRNSAGDPEFWQVESDVEYRRLRDEKATAEKARKLELELRGAAAVAVGAAAEEPAQHEPRWTNAFVLGMNNKISQPYIDKYSTRLEALGAVASAAPNSVLVKNAHMHKGVPVHFMGGSGRLDFRCAVAFGDNPSGNDGPLTTCTDAAGYTIPFVSVAPSLGTQATVYCCFVRRSHGGHRRCCTLRSDPVCAGAQRNARNNCAGCTWAA